MSSNTPVRVEGKHRFAVGLRDGYDYITNLGNLHAYWPDLMRIDPDSRWGAPGDRTRIALRLLGRETEMTMVLNRMEPYRLVEYRSEQSGLPDAHHERHFADDGEHGLAYRAVVEYVPIHSVVVDGTRRGEGLGGVILKHLEEDAVGLGKLRAVLQVIISNVRARAFYRSAGYSEAELRRGPARDRLAYPSVLMRRELATAG